MGVSWADIQAGVLDTGKVVAETMALWNQVTGRTPPVAQTTVPAGSAPTVQNQPMASAAVTAGALPPWLLLVGGGLLVWALVKKRG
jgi:hypothetical protein